jgi:hypothetical protein
LELSESFTQRVEVELKRINKEFEVELVRRVMVEMLVIFDIKEGDVTSGSRLKDDPQSVMKDVLTLVRNRVSSFKDKLAILNENKELLMKERLQFEG